MTLVDKRAQILEFATTELVEALQYYLRGLGVVFRLGEEVAAVERRAAGGALTRLRSGKQIVSELVLYAAGRQGATADLDLHAAGLEADARGRIAVDAGYRTAQPHIFAAGDVIGFPSLAATSMEQGRLAALAAFGEPARSMPALLPVRHLHDPRDLVRRDATRPSSQRARCPTSSASPATASSRAARSPATDPAC